jgi:hypothetical protein
VVGFLSALCDQLRALSGERQGGWHAGII